MLLRFGVRNHLSIRDYQEISLVASAAIKDKSADLIETQATKERILPVVVVYGANGSGKTNVLNALGFLRRAVVNSHTSGGPDTKIPVSPFRLDKISNDAPTELDCDFITRNVRYKYSITLSRECVKEESLYAFPRNRAQLWFHRKSDKIEFGRSLKGQNAATFDLTRRNSLFLSAAASNNHEQLSEIFRFFRHGIVDYDEVPPFGYGEYSSFSEIDEYKKQILELLRSADFGIADISTSPIEEPADADEFREDMAALLEKHLGGRGQEVSESLGRAMKERRKIEFMHKGDGNRLYPLPINLESRGTQTFLNLLAPALTALSSGHFLIIDELDTSLHSLLARKLVSLFNSARSNTRQAQLIVTTHDTNLLSPKVLRRDQVWFTERGVDGATQVFPLLDFRTRNTDDFEKGYLEGRFGAVPIIDTFESHVVD